jgi:hypothetical protein
MTRYKVEAARELYSLKNRLASQLRTQVNTANAVTAKVCEGVIPSLQKQIEALEAEIITLPEQPERRFRHTDGNFPCLTRTTPLSDEEMAQLEIPAFLKRQPKATAL